MAGKGIASKTTAQPKSVARRLWRVMRSVLYMLRRGVLPSGRKVAMDLCLLLRRGKIAGKPCQVEFGSSNASFSAKRRGPNRRQSDDEAAGYYDAADIAKVFEMLSDAAGNLFGDEDALALATPSPAPWSSAAAFGRIADSPCPDAAGELQVDRKADEFIRRFYEQLRAQKSVAATPDYYGYAGGSCIEHGPRPVATGIA